MKTIKFSIIFMTVITFTSCGIFRNYRTVTTKPERYFSGKTIAQDTSILSFDLKVDLKSIEEKVNEMFSEPFSDSEIGEFDQQYTAKIRNPTYDPVEWTKTKDPLYHPNKWYKTKIFGKIIKTKDPLYHPNKWIKTKNPKYDPNKWIYANTVRVQVGYKYDFRVQKRQNIKFENIANNTLRVIIPIDVEGSVGFNGDGAKLLALDEKSIKTKVDFIVDSKLSFDSNWCPIVESKINHKWVSDPKIELAGGVWLNLKLPVDIGMDDIENEVEKEIINKIECAKLTNELKKWIKPSSLELTDLNRQLYLNINPNKFYISNLFVDQANLNIKFSSKLIVGIGTKKLYYNKPIDLPKLERYTFDENIIAVTVPLSIEYKALEDNLNELLTKDGLKYDENDSKFEVLEFEIYPSGENVTIGLKLAVKIPGNILSTKGKIYLTAEPVMNNKVFELKNILFSTELDNKLYPLVGAIFKEKIITNIHSATKKDLTDSFDIAENIIDIKLKEQLKNINSMDVNVRKVVFDVPYISIQEHEFIIPVRLASGVEIRINNVW